MKRLSFAYLVPAAIALYGLVGMVRAKLRLTDHGQSPLDLEGLPAIMMGAALTMLGYLIWILLRWVESEQDPRWDPFTTKRRWLGLIMLGLMTAAGMSQLWWRG